MAGTFFVYLFVGNFSVRHTPIRTPPTDQSGIIASLVAGFTMKDFARPNLTARAQRMTTESLKILAHASETFIFVQVGINTSLYGFSDFDIGFITLTIVMCIACRALSTFVLSFFHNSCRRETSSTYLPRNFQVVSFWAGLRGAIAFAVAFGFPNDNSNRSLVISTVCFVILFTVLVQGGTTRMTLSKMGIQTGVEPETKKDLKRKEAALNKSAFRMYLLGVSRYIKSYVHRTGAISSPDDAVQVQNLIGSGAEVVDPDSVTLGISSNNNDGGDGRKEEEIGDGDVAGTDI